MHIPTPVVRLASATLLSLLAVGVTGVGTAAAAEASSSNTPAAIDIAAKPAPMAQVGPGSTFTDTFVVTNHGQDSAKDTALTMSFDPAVVQLQGVQFDQSGAWVTGVTPNGFQADLGGLGRGEAVTISASFMALGGYSASTTPQAQLEATWRNDSNSKLNNTKLRDDMITTPMVTSMGQNSGLVSSSAAGLVNVSAAGFAPNEAVTLWYNLPDGTAAGLYVRNGQLTTEKTHQERDATDHNRELSVNNGTAIYADANGRINITFATANLAPGAYSIVVHGLNSGTNVVIPFRLN